jgi:LPXTG-motif cell wall-anchored protein
VQSTSTLTPSESAECTQEIRQAAGATPAKAAPAAAPAPTAAAAPAPTAGAPAPPAQAKAGAAQAKTLPATGGLDIASLLGLGAGALLVSGGLLVRKIIR